MNKNQIIEGLTFDDVLLLPGYADFKRDEVDLTTVLSSNLILKVPIISSPMDTVTEDEMAITLGKAGGLGVIHRNLSIGKQVDMVRKVKEKKVKVAAAVGVGEDFKERVKHLVEAKTDVLVIDSGHGFTKFVIEASQYIKKNYPEIILMAGNIATYEAAKALIKTGVDLLRVGMGPGSICTTRIVTGMGVPQLTAISEAVRACSKTKVKVIADGGIRQIGDIAKALAFGASAVMLGSLLARFKEAPGKLVQIEGKKYKVYRGMGSISAMKKGSAERYGYSLRKEEKKLVAEGVEGLIPFEGKLTDFIYQIVGGLRSSFYYIGAKNLKEFQKKARFIKISRAGVLESHPHNVKIIDSGKSYLKN